MVSVSRMARHYTIHCSLPNTHTVYIELDDVRQAGREWPGRSDEGWRMGGGSKGRVGRDGATGE